MKLLDEVLAANGGYVTGFDKGDLPMPPGCHFEILTCMDARLDPTKYAGLAVGDAHVIRNAGGRATNDVIRSLVISYKLLGTREWFVVHYTDCSMETFTNEIIGELLAQSLCTATLDENGWKDVGEGEGSHHGKFIHWLTKDDSAKCLVDDVLHIRHHPLVPPEIPIYGYTYDVKTGNLTGLPETTEAGKPR